jgi:hypothetical protein
MNPSFPKSYLQKKDRSKQGLSSSYAALTRVQKFRAALGLSTGGASIPFAIGGAAEVASVGGQADFAVGTGIGFFSCATSGGEQRRSQVRPKQFTASSDDS